MGRKLYKYIAPGLIDVVFSGNDFCGFKLSYAEDYNDPYELFLNVDFQGRPDAAAFYNDVVQETPQYPITCFSSSPIVAPMWAHYAHNLEGFVVEVDEDRLKTYESEIVINNVAYQDSPRHEIADIFNMAFARGKPRDLMMLRQAVFHSAYFTKTSCWSYESERRLLVPKERVANIKGNMIFNIPFDCVTSVISGPRALPNHKNRIVEICGLVDAYYYSAKIGRSSPEIYFSDINGSTFIFNRYGIEACNYFCLSCNEPVIGQSKSCMWCAVTDEHRHIAASKNVLRKFSELGILDKYVDGYSAIGKK